MISGGLLVVVEELPADLLLVLLDDKEERVNEEGQLLRLGACVAALGVVAHLVRLDAEGGGDLQGAVLFDLNELVVRQLDVQRLEGKAHRDGHDVLGARLLHRALGVGLDARHQRLDVGVGQAARVLQHALGGHAAVVHFVDEALRLDVALDGAGQLLADRHTDQAVKRVVALEVQHLLGAEHDGPLGCVVAVVDVGDVCQLAGVVVYHLHGAGVHGPQLRVLRIARVDPGVGVAVVVAAQLHGRPEHGRAHEAVGSLVEHAVVAVLAGDADAVLRRRLLQLEGQLAQALGQHLEAGEVGRLAQGRALHVMHAQELQQLVEAHALARVGALGAPFSVK